MDREPEEIQFLGIYGIYKEAFNTILSWKNTYSQVTLALIFPLAFIFLAQNKIYVLFLTNILLNKEVLDDIQSSRSIYHMIIIRVICELTTFFLLIKSAYFFFALILTLLASTVKYIVLYIYTSRKVSFQKAINLVTKVCERLMITFLCNFLAMLGYNIITILIGIPCAMLMENTIFMISLIILLVLYLIGFTFLNVLWHFASVVSVFEDMSGIQAMIKSKDLVKGKMWITCVIFFKLHISFLAIQIAFHKLAVPRGESVGSVNKVCYGLVCFSFLTIFSLYILIFRTMVLFVHKKSHLESINNISHA